MWVDLVQSVEGLKRTQKLTLPSPKEGIPPADCLHARHSFFSALWLTERWTLPGSGAYQPSHRNYTISFLGSPGAQSPILGLVILHNHRSQLLIIHSFTYKCTYILWVLFLWRTLTSIVTYKAKALRDLHPASLFMYSESSFLLPTHHDARKPKQFHGEAPTEESWDPAAGPGTLPANSWPACQLRQSAPRWVQPQGSLPLSAAQTTRCDTEELLGWTWLFRIIMRDSRRGYSHRDRPELTPGRTW